MNTFSPNIWARVSSMVHTPMEMKEICWRRILFPSLLMTAVSARKPETSLPSPELMPMHMMSWAAFSPFLFSSWSRGISLAKFGR